MTQKTETIISKDSSKKTDDHGLSDAIVFGPVVSRRYGSSLGINLLPLQSKLCNFDCIYCQLGFNVAPSLQMIPEFPTLLQVKISLGKFLDSSHSKKKIDTVCIGGNGEPTLNPEFLDISKLLKLWTNKHYPTIKLVCLTNGTRLMQKKIQTGLKLYDECCLKLDAHPTSANQSPPINFGNRLDGFNNLVIQSCFFEGSVQNTDSPILNDWLNRIISIPHQRVDLYTISRASAAEGLKAVSRKTLLGIKSLLQKHSIRNVRIVY